MKTEASDYLINPNKSELFYSEFEEFINFISEETEKTNRRESPEHLPRVIELMPDQIIKLLKNNLIEQSIDLQYLIKREISIRHYKEAEIKSENESPWMTALLLMGSMSI